MCATSPEIAKQCFFQTYSEGFGKTTVIEFLLRYAGIPASLKRLTAYSALFRQR